MLIKIIFKDLVNCNPTGGSRRPMLSLRIQNTEIIIPTETFRWRVDGYSVVIEVEQYEQRGPVWEFKTIVGRFPSVKFEINPRLISKIKEIV